jgi:hypothetical protein
LHEKAQTSGDIGRDGRRGVGLSAETKDETRTEATTDAAAFGESYRYAAPLTERGLK